MGIQIASTKAVMKHPKLLAFVVILLAIPTLASLAQAQTIAQDRVDSLRQQLEEIKNNQLDLESRLQVLDDQSQPENIEKSLAGVGSTHPEDLREFRRKQLDKEKQSIQQQLALLTTSQTRLESAIAQAEADAYHQSAKGPSVSTAADNETTPTITKSVHPRRAKKRIRN